MPSVSFKKKRGPIEVPVGANLMQALLESDIPVASSCDGDGVCAKCRLIIVAGNENLSLPNETEEFLKESNDIAKEMRISCQVQVLGPVTVDATYW